MRYRDWCAENDIAFLSGFTGLVDEELAFEAGRKSMQAEAAEKCDQQANLCIADQNMEAVAIDCAIAIRLIP